MLKDKRDVKEATGDETTEKGTYVANPVTGKCHKALVYTGLPKFWRARCSWTFGLTHYNLQDTPVDGYKRLCDTCLHHLREQKKTSSRTN